MLHRRPPSESVYSEITASTARRDTEEILDVLFSADSSTLTLFNCCLSVSFIRLWTPVTVYFSLSFCKKKPYYSRRWPFLILCLRFHFLATWCLTQNKHQDVSRKDRACPEVRGFWPPDIVFTVTPPARKKWQGITNRGREEGRSGDRLPHSEASCERECHLHYQGVILSCLQKLSY